MSYILDALRRADAERERGAVPSLQSQQHTIIEDDAATARPRSLVWAVVALALALLAVLGWNLLGGGAPPPRAPIEGSITTPVPAPLPALQPAPALPTATAPAVPRAPRRLCNRRRPRPQRRPRGRVPTRVALRPLRLLGGSLPRPPQRMAAPARPPSLACMLSPSCRMRFVATCRRSPSTARVIRATRRAAWS